VVLARQAKTDPRPNLYAGSILTASGVMYARLVLLLAFFDRPLAAELAPSFLALAATGGLAGWAVSRRRDAADPSKGTLREARNPLELGAAFVFAVVFVVIVVLTNLARDYMGRTGLYALAALMGVTDVDPFVLGLTQSGATATPLRVAAAAIVIAAASNNVIKAIYAYSFADRVTGRKSLALLLALAALGLVPLAWI
jgi:uncharacterized membrane protein (DUF4010 family)